MPAWVEADSLDSNLLVRLGMALAQYSKEHRVSDSAAMVGIAQEAAEIFQLFHFSFDPIYWDARDFPSVVAAYIAKIIDVLNQEPTWIKSCYCNGRETLIDLLRRHRVASEGPEFMPP